MDDATDVQVFAIIPAAGRSARMGEPKQLLPTQEGTVLESVIEAVLRGDINGLCVVTSSAIDEALAVSQDPRFIVALNDDPDSEMLDSIRLGMAALNERCQVHDTDGYMVCPGDMPQVSVEDVRAVAGAYRAAPGGIVIAAHAGTKGHPMVFPVALATEVQRIEDGGLKVLAERHARRVRLIECASPGVIQDLDTPEDYQRLMRDT